MSAPGSAFGCINTVVASCIVLSASDMVAPMAAVNDAVACGAACGAACGVSGGGEPGVRNVISANGVSMAPADMFGPPDMMLSSYAMNCPPVLTSPGSVPGGVLPPMVRIELPVTRYFWPMTPEVTKVQLPKS